MAIELYNSLWSSIKVVRNAVLILRQEVHALRITCVNLKGVLDGGDYTGQGVRKAMQGRIDTATVVLNNLDAQAATIDAAIAALGQDPAVFNGVKADMRTAYTLLQNATAATIGARLDTILAQITESPEL